MLNFENCVLNKVVIHRVGNKYAGEQLELSRECFLSDDEDTVKILKEYFLSSFKREAFYHFMPYEDELLNNPTYSAVSGVFDEHTAFYSESVKIAEHLFEQSNRPDVKPGELYMVHFSDVNTDEGACDAIGIFKSENKDTFLKIYQSQDSYQLHSESGINIKKLDKACLILNVNRESGYKILVTDKGNAKDGMYWTTDFLGLQPSEDSYFQTSNYLNLCKDFVKDIYNNENDVPKADQIDMLNRSLDFFKQADVFSEDAFMNEVVQKPEVIDAFEHFKQQYVQTNQVPVSSTFNISDYAVKDEKKYFKHVLKLDKNFHVYIHGQRKYIEKGYDTARDMNYYKLYFRDEE